MSDGGMAPGWNEYKLLVLEQIQALGQRQVSVETKLDTFRQDDIQSLRVEVALLKQKASLYGAIAGLIPSAIAALIWWLSQGK